jgi:hypothetical protein
MGRDKDSLQRTRRLYLVNCPLLLLYRQAYPQVFNLPFSRILVDERVAALFKPSGGEPAPRFCYELQGPPLTDTALAAAVQADLLRCFNTRAFNDKRSMPCYVLSATKQVSCAVSRGGPAQDNADSLALHPQIRNSPVSSLLAVLGSRFGDKPWLDETGLELPVDIVFPPGFYHCSLQQVRDFLLGYGLQVSEASRTLGVAVIAPATSE